MNPVIVTEGQVQGNITSCKIETVPISFSVKLFNPIKETTYRTYNVCTGEVIREFGMYETSIFFGLYAVVFLIICAMLAIKFDKSNL